MHYVTRLISRVLKKNEDEKAIYTEIYKEYYALAQMKYISPWKTIEDKHPLINQYM